MTRVATSGVPKPPEHLSSEAAGWWNRIAGEYELEDSALLIFESALSAFDRMRAAQKLIAVEGVTYKDRFGQPKQNPATLVERDAKSTMLRCLKALNLDLEPIGAPGRPEGSVKRAY